MGGHPSTRTRDARRDATRRDDAKTKKKIYRTWVTMFPSRTAITVTGTHNPSSVNTCVIPALEPKAPTPESSRARGVTHAPRRVAERDVVGRVVIVTEDGVVNADAREDNIIIVVVEWRRTRPPPPSSPSEPPGGGARARGVARPSACPMMVRSSYGDHTTGEVGRCEFV